MFCPKCHTHIIDDSTKFCSRCGENLEKKKRKSSFSTGSTFSSISSGSTFKYMSKYGKKDSLSKFDYENIGNEETLERILNEDPEGCNINQPANNNNHNDQFNYNLRYSGVTKKRQTHDEQFNYSKNYSGVTKKGKTHDEQYNYSQKYSGVQPTTQQQTYPQQRTYDRTYANQPQITSDDSYRLAFIGPNKESIIKSSFSVPALLFGPLYLIYRKMIGIGLLIEIIILILQASFGSDTATALQIFIHIILAFKFRTMYLNFVNKKVKQIRENNQNKTSTEIAYECSQKGKTLNFKKIITYAILFYFLTLAASAYYEVNQKSIKDIYDVTNNPTYNTNMKEPKFKIGSYGFQSSYDDNIIQKESNNTSLVLEYSPSITEKCTFTIERAYSDISAFTFLNNQKQYFPSYNISSIRSNSFNNKTWYYMNFYDYNGENDITMYAMKDYGNEEIYTISVVPENSYSCNNIAENIMDNFEKNY